MKIRTMLKADLCGEMTHLSALEAAKMLSRRYKTAEYICCFIEGKGIPDNEMLKTCNVEFDRHYDDYIFTLYPCTGGVIHYENNVLSCTKDKVKSLLNEGIDFKVDNNLKESKINIINYDVVMENYISSPYNISPDLEDQDDMIMYSYNYTYKLYEAEKYLDYVWVKYHKRVPKRYSLIEGNSMKQIELQEIIQIGNLIKKVPIKSFLRFASDKSKLECTHDRIAYLNICCKYGINEITQLSRKGGNWNDIWEKYSIVSNNRVHLLSKSDSNNFIKSLGKIPDDIIIDKKLSVNDIEKMASEYAYSNVIDKEVSWACDQVKLDQHEFERVQEYWTNRTKPTYETIPDVGVVKVDDYKMYRLQKNDPRGPILGKFVNCCQYIGGVGKTCAIHGTESPDGAFFIVEKHGKVIAQSWAWRLSDTVVFDNIETLSNDYLDKIAVLYQKTADSLVGKLGINRIHVGSGYDDLGVDRIWVKTIGVSTPSECYTDAEIQYHVAGTKLN